MKKKMVNLIAVLFTLCMMVGVVYPKTMHAQSAPTITYNVSNKVMPFIYSKSQMIATSSTKVTVLPEGATYLFFYFLPSVANVDHNNASIAVDGKEYSAQNLSWNVSGSYEYAALYLSEPLKSDSKVTANFTYDAIPNFAIRARKNATGKFTDQVEKLIQANPTRYELYNEDRSLVFTGTINTVDSWNNFVHWSLTTGNGDYFKAGDDTKIWNLPDGHYTVSETYGGEKMYTTSTGSSTVYLNASLSPQNDAYGNLSYTFDVNKDLVNKWMSDCLNDNQSNSAFFGFYTETEKYSLSFDNNGGTGEMDKIMDQYSGTSIKLPESTFKRKGYLFTGWNTVANPTDSNPGTFYANEADYQFAEKNETLYAQWLKQSAISHTVYTDDQLKDEMKPVVGMSEILYDNFDLAFNQDELDKAAATYIKEQAYQNAEYTGYTIQIKEKDDQAWKEYKADTKLKDGTQVRYVLHIVEKEKFNLSFDNNGGTGNMDKITDKYSGTSIKLPESTFKRKGYLFTGWNTVANPTDSNPGTFYANEADYQFAEKNETLYAQWLKQSAISHTVYTDDQLKDEMKPIVGMSEILYDNFDLAFNQDELDQAATTYIKEQAYQNAEYTGYTIQIKEKDDQAWKEYKADTKLKDGTQVRYVLHIVEKEKPLPPVDPSDPEEPVNPVPPTEPANPVTPNTPAPFTPSVNVPQQVTPLNPPTENVTPNETPKASGKTETVKGNETPKSKGIGGSWALVNLLAAILTVLLGLFAVISKHSKEEEMEDEESYNEEADMQAFKRRRWSKLMAIIVSIISVILFIVTEDITLPMAYIDEWTIWMIVIAFIQIMMVLITKKWKAIDQEEVQETN